MDCVFIYFFIMTEEEDKAARKAEKRERRARKEAEAAAAAAAAPSSGRPRTRSFERTSPVHDEATGGGSAWLGAAEEGAGWGAVAGSKRRARSGSDAAGAGGGGEAAAAPAAASAAAAKRPRKVEAPVHTGKDDKEESEEEEAEEAAAAAEAAAGGAASAAPAAPAARALSSFRMSKETVAALVKRGVNALFPIQERTFDALYDGADLIGRARTGMGKTLAFVLPIVERLKLDAAASAVRGRKPRVIVMAPTRELAKQVAEDFLSVQGPGLVTLVVYGGTGIEPQKGALWKGIDILVGTPGRIQDLMEGKHLKLDAVKFVVRGAARTRRRAPRSPAPACPPPRPTDAPCRPAARTLPSPPLPSARSSTRPTACSTWALPTTCSASSTRSRR